MKYCNNCASAVDDNAEFCPYCRAAFDATNEMYDYTKTTVLGTGQVNNEYTGAPEQPQYEQYQYQNQEQASAYQHGNQYNTEQQCQNSYYTGNSVIADKNSIFKSYALFWKNYTNFSSRTRRSDFWQFVLVNVLISLIAGAFNFIPILGSIISGIYVLACIIPSLAIQIRRLHDIEKEWYCILLGLIPLVGFIILLVFYCQDSQSGENKFGPNTKEIQ